MQAVLLAFDGSDQSRHAAARAADLARRLGTSVKVVLVGEMIESGYGSLVPVVETEVYDRVLAEGVSLVREAGVEADGTLLWGSPAEKIVEAAEAQGCDPIILGHRGKGGLESLLLGSVAKHVIDRAHCSVMVVR